MSSVAHQFDPPCVNRYLLLSGVQTLYAYFVEGETIYMGKRKTLSKRIETERIIVSSRTIPSQPSQPPRYAVTVNYVRSANGGKSLLGRSSGEGEKPYNELFYCKGLKLKTYDM